MFSKTTLALSAAMVLSATFPALAATKHHYRVTNAHSAIYNRVSPPLLVAAVRRLVAPLAVALAPDLALVHHQIGIDELHFTPRLVLEIDVGERPSAVVAHDKTLGLFIDGPRWREAAFCHCVLVSASEGD